MTIQSPLARISYTVSGAGPYSIPFMFIGDADLVVYSEGDLLTLTSDYTLTGAGDDAGGTLTLVSPVNGERLVIINDPEATQLVDYPEYGKFPAQQHERALDKLTILVKRALDLISRAVKIPDSSTASFDLAPEANKFIGWNNDGTALVNLVGVGSATDAQSVVYTPPGTGAVTTTVQSKLREVVSVFDYMTAAQITSVLAGNLTEDVTTPIQNAVDANAGKTVYFPAGSYKITAAIDVTTAGVRIVGAGNFQSYVFQYTPDEDGFHFAPTTAGSTNSYLSGAHIEGLNIAAASAYTASSTAGAGVRFTQCSGYKLFNVSVNNFMEGITIEGGQLGSLKSFQSNASSGIAGPSASALLNFKAAPYGGAGAYQKMYTVQVEDFRMSGSNLRDSCIRIENADGLNFANGYIAYGLNDLVRVVHTMDSSYVAGVSFTNVYFDCVGTGNTPSAFRFLDDAFTGTNTYDFTIGSGCVLGNGDQYGILVEKPETGYLKINNAYFTSFKKYAINFNVQGSATLSDLQIIGNKFHNCGSDGTGAVIRAAGGRSLNITGNIVADSGSATGFISTSGTYEQGSIVGNVNASNLADIGNNATYTYGYTQSGNSSKFTKGGTSSFVGERYTNIGGSVVQGSGSGKATAVTLNTLEGQITTDAANLAAGATVRFTLNNSTILTNDIIHVHRKSGGTGTSYRVWCDFVSAGTCGICIQNITGGGLAEAVVLQFKVFRSGV